MPITFQNERSQLPATTTEWKVAGSKVSTTTSRSAAATSPASVSGQVNGSATHGAPQLKGRAMATTPARPRDPVGNAVFQNTHELNSVLNGIESLRPGPNAELPPLGKAMLQQIDRIAEACDLITGGPAVGESLVDQYNALSELVGKGESAQGSLEAGMEAFRSHGSSSSDSQVNKELAQIGAWTDQIQAVASDRLKYISQSLNASALSMSKHYETKANMSTAAISVLDEVIAAEKAKGNDKAVAVLEKGKASFETRERRMRQVADERRGDIGDPGKFGGTKKFGVLGTLLHPIKAHAERTARAKCADQIASGKGDADVEAQDTNEMSVVEDALAKVLADAKVSGHHAKHEVQHAFLNVLDANKGWRETISTEIHLPIVSGSPAQSNASRDPLGIVDESNHAPQPLPVQTLIARSEISPAAVSFSSYNGQGVNAHRSTEHLHATNLAHTQLKDSAGNTMFSGVRHGVLSAYGLQKDGVAEKEMPDHELERRIVDLLPRSAWHLDAKGQPDLKATMKAVRSNPKLVDQMRATANTNRAKEVVAMTIASDPVLRQAALNGEKPTVNILSLSLLTPDTFRALRGGLHDNESLMVRDQADAWGSVAGRQTIDIPVEGGTRSVEVDVQPVPMNYGVNQGAVKGILGVHTEDVSGWHVSDTLNDEALHSLFGKDLTTIATSHQGVLGERIGELEARHREDLENAQLALQTHNHAVLRSGGRNPDAANARRLELEAEVRRIESVPDDARTPLGAALQLAQQIAEIHREGAHRNAGTEPYKMPTRLAVLADILNVKVAFNCKSGKDRTGELDAEVKHMKLEMQITGQVPHYKRERSPEEIRRFNEVLNNGGNQRMQELNTGFAGYKLKGVGALYRQFGGDGDGDDALTRNFHGMSHMTAT